MTASTSDMPIDVGMAVYMIMFYQGIGNLLPWNAFITAAGYFSTRFCGTSYVTNFENYFSFSYTVSQTIGLALSVIYQDKISLKNKIIVPLVFYTIIFFLNTVFVVIDDMSSQALFGLTLLSTSLCGLCGATLSAGLFGLGAALPAAYTGALMNGQALAGLMISLSSLLTILSGKDLTSCNSNDNAGGTDDTTVCTYSTDYSALGYFIIATLVLLSCIFFYLLLMKLNFSQFYFKRSGLIDNDIKAASDGFTEPLLSVAQDEENSSKADNKDVVITSIHSNTAVSSLSDASVAAPTNTSSSNSSHIDFKSIKRVFNTIRIPAISVLLVFTISISIFPAVFVLIESEDKCKTSSRFSNDLFIPFLFVMFNLFDFIGRVVAGATTPIVTAKNIWMASLARVVFIPLVLLCNIANSKLPIVFDHDVWPILLMALFAFTNGYVACNSMIYGATIIDPSDAGLAGTIMIFSLCLGLFFGSCCSFIVIAICQ